jgi:futalosine hydrolase
MICRVGNNGVQGDCMKPVLITASTKLELSLLLAAAEASPLANRGFLDIQGGRIGKHEVFICETGVGKANAAAATAVALERIAPGLLINTGCAGAFADSGLIVGDIAVADQEVFADEGVLTPAGWHPLELIGIPLLQRDGLKYFNEIPLTPKFARLAQSLASPSGSRIRNGRFLTVSTCTGTSERGGELQQRFGAVCENMEGAAVALVALRYGVAALEVRGVSNMVEDRNLSRWDIGLAVEQVQRFLISYIKALSCNDPEIW